MTVADHCQDVVLRLREDLLDKSSVAIAQLHAAGLIQVSGPAAFSYLHNRSSNDVNALQDGEGHVNTVLDKSARIQGAFTLHREGEGLWLLTDRAQVPHLMPALEKFRILEPVTFTDVSESYAVFVLQGGRAATLLASVLIDERVTMLASEGLLVSTVEGQTVWVVNHSISGEPGFVLWTPIAHGETLVNTIEAAAASQPICLDTLTEEALEVLRIEAGIPKYGAEFDTTTLLPETGLEQTAVSYTKGCYLGQETVARVKTYGSVQKALIGLLFEPGITLPQAPGDIFLEGELVGTITSGCFSPTLNVPIAMAYLNKASRVPGKTITVVIHGLPYTLTVMLLPLVRSNRQQDKAKTLLDEGLAAFAQNRDEAAIGLLRQALALDATLADAYEALGVMLSRGGDYEEAIALTLKLAELDPDRIMAQTNLSLFYMKIGQKETAEEHKAKATVLAFRQKAKAAGLTADPELERQKREAATRDRIRMFKDALQYSPDDPLGNFGLGSAYLELDEFENAVEPLRKTLAANPNQSTAYVSLGKALEALNKRDEAVEVYQQGIAVASTRRDMMPLNAMQARLTELNGGAI